jgi:hypothetical protein
LARLALRSLQLAVSCTEVFDRDVLVFEVAE